MIYTVTFNPALDYVISVDHFTPGKINRTVSENMICGGKGINVSALLANLGPEDVVLIISNSGSSKRLETLALGAKENGSTLVLITNNRESPLAQICDYKIITATREKLLTEEFWFSRVTATTVIEIIYLLLMAGKKDAVEHIRRHEKAILSDKQRG